MNNATKRTLAAATAFLIFATAASRLLGLVREIVQVYYLGLGDQMSAFTAAQKLPNLVRALLADTALSAAFIPVFSGLLEKDKRREAWQAAYTVSVMVAIVLGVVTVLGIIFAPQVVKLVVPGYKNADQIALTVSLTRIMFPQLIALGLAGIAMGILNSYNHFSIPAIAPIVWNVIIILSLVVFSFFIGFKDSQGLIKNSGFEALAWATFLGTVVMLLIQAPAVWRRRWREPGERLRLNFRDPALRQMGLILGPVMISLGIINFNALVDTQFASYLHDASAVAVIDKAFRLFQLPQGVFAIAIGTVLFPALSRHAAGNRFKEFKDDLSMGIRQIFFLTLPFVAFFVLLAVPTVRLIYQHGREVDSAQIASVASALTFFSVGMAFVSVNTLLNRAFYSIRKSWLPLVTGVVNLALNALLDWAFYKRLGVGGITLSTSLVSLFNFFGLMVLLRMNIGTVDELRVLRSFARAIVALIPLAAVAYGVWWGLDALLGRSNQAQILSVGAAYVLGAGAYLLAARAMRMEEARDIVSAIRRRRSRGRSLDGPSQDGQSQDGPPAGGLGE